MSDPVKPELVPLTPPERSRTYHFPDGGKVTLKNVTHLLVRPRGTHRLIADGVKWVVMPGFVAIELDVDEWTL